MAIMHPAKIPEVYHAYSEVKFFNACKEQLSDKYPRFLFGQMVLYKQWYQRGQRVRLSDFQPRLRVSLRGG